MSTTRIFCGAVMAMLLSVQACRKSTDGALRDGLSSEAVVGPGPSQPQPTLVNPLQFRANVELSLNRAGVVAVAAGRKLIFAGGVIDDNTGIGGFHAQSRVDIFDTATLIRTTAELSTPRWNIGATAIGNKVFFAGGYIGYETPTDKIDIYDVSTNSWSTATLSQARGAVAVAAAGNKVIFAGGTGETVPGYYSNVIDIYTLTSKVWTTGSFLSNQSAVATSTGNTIAIAGYNSSGYSNARILNVATNTWSTEALYFNLYPFSITAAGAAGKIVFGGSENTPQQPPLIRILNTGNMQWSQPTVTGNRIWSASCSAGNYAFMLNKSSIYPHALLSSIDIYNANLDKWYKPNLAAPARICAATGKTLAVKGDGTTVQVYNVKE